MENGKKRLTLREMNGMEIGIDPKLEEELKALAQKDGCETIDEFNRILAQGRLLDKVIRKGAMVIVHYNGQETNIEDLFNPILDKLKKTTPTNP
jgi:hypothetical protein